MKIEQQINFKRQIVPFFGLFVIYSLFFLASTTAQNTQLTEIRYLTGTDKDHTTPWDFYCSSGQNSKKWTTIETPSCWELQGFGHYNYGHDPFEKRVNEYGLYKHQFSVPKSWKNKTVKIVFEGVMTDAEVKINGKLAGAIHQGAFYEFKYDITNLLKYGNENLIEVKVNKASSNESINHAERKADFWIFGGIYRPVYLEVLPQKHINRVAIDAKANGQITADVFLGKNTEGDLKASLLDIKGNLVQKLDLDLSTSDQKWQIKTLASNIKTWNPESPHLYQLELSLFNKKGQLQHQIKQRIGFRTVKLYEGDGIYVNGQRIKFKGVNRHSFYPSSGRTTSKALSIEHVEMMKDMNMNAVRMSHYPPDVHFLDVCDSLGLFVINEVCTWHSPSLDTEVGEKIVKETVVRDVNHPSILLWANGNESGWNTELDDDYALWDIQQREVIHPWNIFNKTNTLHYFHFHGLANDGPATDKIFFPTEFLHGLYDGGHGAGLEDYWEKMWNMPNNAGGFLWDFADEAVVRTDKNGVLDTDGNHAADGIIGPYGEKEASYFTIKEIWSPIFIEDRTIKNDFNGIFRIENRYHYTSLASCKMTAKLISFKGNKNKVIEEKAIQLPSLEPSEKGAFKVEKTDSWNKADALHLTAYDPNGKEIFTWSYPINAPENINQKLIEEKGDNSKKALKVKQEQDKIVITSSSCEFTFSNQTGKLKKVTKNNQVIPLSNGPILLGKKDKVDTVKVIPTENYVDIIAVFEPKNKMPEWTKIVVLSSDSIKWRVHQNGLLDLEVEMKGKKRTKEVLGISFNYKEEDVAGMKWLGDGPYRVWRNRTKGTRFQVWENDYNNTITGESGFVYPEFKGYFSHFYWAELKSKSTNGFKVYCHSPNVFLRMLTPENPSGDPKGRVSPFFPKGDLSFVYNIPAIGTKFQESSSTGPHGNEEIYYGNSDDPLRIKLTFEF
ncbi:glycoside hydrolase family 2 protein [Flammeovirga sp. EKP202]|uniref:glycoside hydrolase family 2 protein n=1 Tax=Flammeovirga sp. EKP202 TaxID=2770592 RepID=UPI00165FE554|nr:glycoside hydrolase family 2 TIM barrel-domain containing protein [Flammeovirga sp. EKP202]MBD0401637.1 beta-galactosidase [Flammeovirga sp. EKP202]